MTVDSGSGPPVRFPDADQGLPILGAVLNRVVREAGSVWCFSTGAVVGQHLSGDPPSARGVVPSDPLAWTVAFGPTIRRLSSQASTDPPRGAYPLRRGHAHARAVRAIGHDAVVGAKAPRECCGQGGPHLRLIVDQEQNRVVYKLWSGQGRVRCVCHADRGIAAIAPSVEAAGQRTDPFDATSSQD